MSTAMPNASNPINAPSAAPGTSGMNAEPRPKGKSGNSNSSDETQICLDFTTTSPPTAPETPTLFQNPRVEDIDRRKHGGNENSEEAVRTIDREKWQARVIALLLTRPDTGATADEAAAHFGVAHNTVAPRFSELKRDGKILPLVYEGVKIRRLTRAGCKSQVFVAAKGAKQ